MPAKRTATGRPSGGSDATNWGKALWSAVLTRGLFGIALLCVLIGVGLVFASSTAQTAAGTWVDLVARGKGAFEDPAWHWLLRADAFACAVAAVLGGAARIASIRRGPNPVRFDEIGAGSLKEALAEIRRRVGECVLGARPNVIAAVDELVRGAVKLGASDIHVSPSGQGLRLTYRVHGTLHDVATLESAMGPLLATRVKVLARLDTYVRGTPQDGRLVMNVGEGSVEARVSTLPTELGERVVLRFVRGTRTVSDLDGLGFAAEVHDGLVQLLARPQGLLFVTGPVGSGKTTTLYAALKHIARTRGRTTSLVTLEDPIELELPFATQTQMHPRAGMTFAGTLRSVLRQDPNVLMLGEIRDRETAEVVAQAGLTGHLILTTVHAEGAAGPFARLIEMGIEPFIVASSAVGCLSQRLVRTLCVACRREVAAEPIHVERFAAHGIVLPPGPYFDAPGCDFCEGQGYTGRVPIAELLPVNATIRQAVGERRATSDLGALAVAEGMTPVLRDGLARALAGDTSLTEVLRVAG